MRFWVKHKGDLKEVLLKHAYSRFLQARYDATSFLITHTHDAHDLPLPKRQTLGAAGMDLHANVHEPVCIKKGARVLIPTGVKIALPIGYEAQVRPRSGLALNFGVTVLNAPGTVDADYRGELCALLINLGEKDFFVRRGDRIAQLVITKVEMIEFSITNALPDSLRGEGGYGSTGIKGSHES